MKTPNSEQPSLFDGLTEQELIERARQGAAKGGVSAAIARGLGSEVTGLTLSDTEAERLGIPTDDGGHPLLPEQSPRDLDAWRRR